MDTNEKYQKYIQTYQIGLRDCDIPRQLDLMKSIDLLENLTINEFIQKLNTDSKFKDKWG